MSKVVQDKQQKIMDRFQQYQRSQEEANRAVIESAIQAMTSKAAAQAQVATARASGAHLLANRLPGTTDGICNTWC